MNYPCTLFFSWSHFSFFSGKTGIAQTFFLSSTFDTHSLILPLTHMTNVVQKTFVAFRFSFYPFSRNDHFLTSFLSRPEVHEVGKWFAVLPMKAVCLWNWCFQWTHCSSQVFLSQDSVETCENTYNRLVPSGLRSPPALQANCYCHPLSFYFRRCHISSWCWAEIEDRERTVMDGLMSDSEKGELRYLDSWSSTLSDKRRPGAWLLAPLWNYLQVPALIWLVWPKKM